MTAFLKQQITMFSGSKGLKNKLEIILVGMSRCKIKKKIVQRNACNTETECFGD